MIHQISDMKVVS